MDERRRHLRAGRGAQGASHRKGDRPRPPDRAHRPARRYRPQGDGAPPRRAEGPGDPNLSGDPHSCEPRRSEERREGKSVSVRVDLGGPRIIKKKNKTTNKYLT